jgi:hypothetical protein
LTTSGTIKLRFHIVEERSAQLAPDQIKVQQRGIELKMLKKLVIELERELERLQRGAGGGSRRVC